jgi:hypothetical protein
MDQPRLRLGKHVGKPPEETACFRSNGGRMFSLAWQRLSGRRVLVIEADNALAAVMQSAVIDAGGTALGPLQDIDEALCYIATIGRVDCVLLDTSVTASTSRPIPELFRDRQIETVFVTGYDDWFDDEDADEEAEGRPLRAYA